MHDNFELAARLLAHADAHANGSPHDDEQAQWENDLREAARALSAQGEAVLAIYAEGSMRTVTEWLDGARDLPDGDYKLYTHPAPRVEVDEAMVALRNELNVIAERIAEVTEYVSAPVYGMLDDIEHELRTITAALNPEAGRD